MVVKHSSINWLTQMNLVLSINGDKMRILIWFVHVTAVTSILLGIVCLFNQQVGLGSFIVVNGLAHFFTSILFHGQQKHFDLQVVNKHLAESVFGPTADSVKKDIKKEYTKIKTEIIIDAAKAKEEIIVDAAKVKEEIKNEAEKVKTLVEKVGNGQ